MHVAARLRNVLARRRWLYWAAVALLAAAAALVMASAGAAVDDARRSWGETRTVFVATADVVPGAALDGAAERRVLPVPLIPAAALGEVPVGAVARQHVSRGEVVVAADVAPTATPQALIPAGWSGVAVAEAVPSGAVTGDAVTAVAEGVVLAAEGLVVGRSGAAVLVAVPDGDAPAVAMAAAAGTLALLLVP
jgi:hypothetical protein